jgi:hypothetical protein
MIFRFYARMMSNPISLFGRDEFDVGRICWSDHNKGTWDIANKRHEFEISPSYPMVMHQI